MSTPLLSVEGLAVSYGGVVAIDGIDLAVGEGRALALLGANGAGKSTLLKAIVGLVTPSVGRILFDGAEIQHLAIDRRVKLGLGYCPEGRRVFPGLTVAENLLVACWSDARARAARLAEMFELFPDLGVRRASPAWQLSGGQQQMLAIARALMNRPRLLLLDEPSLGLSPRLTDEVFGRIPAIVAEGTSILLAEQNMAKAFEVCDHGVVLKVGRVAASGSGAELVRRSDVTAAFLGG